MKIKIKKLNEKAVIPTYAKEGDAGMDLTATSKSLDEYGNVVYGTGLAFEIPKGYVGLLFPRSSNAKKYLSLTNSVGVLDSGYRGEVMFKYRSSVMTYNPLKFWWHVILRKNNKKKMTLYTSSCGHYDIGDRIGQLVIVKHPYIELVEVDELSETERGAGSYGSTGK